MDSMQRVGGRGKKSRRLGKVEVLERSDYEAMELETKVELILGLIPLGLMHVEEVLAEKVRHLAGDRYARKGEAQIARRHGTNPGSVRMAGQRVAVRVPRVRGDHGRERGRGEIALRTYQALHGSGGQLDEVLLRRVLYGISCRNYEQAAEAIPGAIGLSSSSVSREFVKASAAQLRAFQERELSGEEYVALFLDGKTFADATMVIALGVTIQGDKRFLGFVETGTENEKVLSAFLHSLVARGVDISQGILVIIDGGKGLRAAVRQAFSGRAVLQRCQWHKRENVVSYLPKREQTSWRRRLQRALDRPTLEEARSALDKLEAELEQINQSAAASLREGLDEVLTLHRLGAFALLGRSFKTTNCLENVNALVEERLNRVMGYRHLAALRKAVQRELKISGAARAQARAA